MMLSTCLALVLAALCATISALSGNGRPRHQLADGRKLCTYAYGSLTVVDVCESSLPSTIIPSSDSLIANLDNNNIHLPNPFSYTTSAGVVPRGCFPDPIMPRLALLRFLVLWVFIGFLGYVIGHLLLSSFTRWRKNHASNIAGTRFNNLVGMLSCLRPLAKVGAKNRQVLPAELYLTRAPPFSPYALGFAMSFFRSYNVRGFRSGGVRDSFKHSNGCRLVLRQQLPRTLLLQPFITSNDQRVTLAFGLSRIGVKLIPKKKSTVVLGRSAIAKPNFFATSTGLIIRASNHQQVTAVSSHIRAVANRQHQVRNGLSKNRQPLIHVIDPRLFAYALESALQVPKYRKQVFFLVEKYLKVDCYLVKRLTSERDEALRHNKNWAAHSAKMLEQTKKHYKDQAQGREAQWKKFHAKGLADQQAGFDNQLAIMQTNFNSRLKKEQENGRIARAETTSYFSNIQAKFEKEARYQKQRVSDLKGLLVDLKTSFAAEKATYETKLGVQQGFRLQLRAKVEDLELQVAQMTADHKQEVSHKRAMLELVNNNVGELVEVTDLQLDRLERKEVQINGLRESKKQLIADHSQRLLQVKAESEAAKNDIAQVDQQKQVADQLSERLTRSEASEAANGEQIADLKRQLEECKSILRGKTAEVENFNIEKKQLIAECDQKISQAQAEVEEVKKEKAQQEQVAKALQDRLKTEVASSEKKDKRNHNLSQRLKECQSTLQKMTAEVGHTEAETQSKVSIDTQLQEGRSALEIKAVEKDSLKDEADSRASDLTNELGDCPSALEVQSNKRLSSGDSPKMSPAISYKLTELAGPALDDSNKESLLGEGSTSCQENSNRESTLRGATTPILEDSAEESSLIRAAAPILETAFQVFSLTEGATAASVAYNEEPRIHPWPTPGFEGLDAESIMYPSSAPKKTSLLQMDKMRKRGGAPMPPKKPEQDCFAVSAQYKEDIFEGDYPLDDYLLIVDTHIYPVSLPDRAACLAQTHRPVEIGAAPPTSVSRDVHEMEVERISGTVIVALPGRTRMTMRTITSKAEDAQTPSAAAEEPEEGLTNAITTWTAPW